MTTGGPGYTASSRPKGRTDTLTPLEQARRTAALCEEKLATDVAILDMRAVCDYTDYFVLASGRNARQTKAIHDEVHGVLKREHGLAPRSVSGLPEASWIVGDYLDVVLHEIDRAKAERPGQIGPPLKKLAEHFGRRGIVVIVSDFYAEPDEVFEAIGPIRFRGNDVVLFHVLDPTEVDFSFAEPASFEDLESGEQIPIVPDALADQYRSLVQEHIAELTRRASAQQVDYTLLTTSTPLDFALFRYLSSRDRLARRR